MAGGRDRVPQDSGDLDEDDDHRWLWVPCEGSRDGYRDMELFAALVEDRELAARLERALSGRGVFRGQGRPWPNRRPNSSIGTRSVTNVNAAGLAPGSRQRATPPPPEQRRQTGSPAHRSPHDPASPQSTPPTLSSTRLSSSPPSSRSATSHLEAGYTQWAFPARDAPRLLRQQGRSAGSQRSQVEQTSCILARLIRCDENQPHQTVGNSGSCGRSGDAVDCPPADQHPARPRRRSYSPAIPALTSPPPTLALHLPTIRPSQSPSSSLQLAPSRRDVLQAPHTFGTLVWTYRCDDEEAAS